MNYLSRKELRKLDSERIELPNEYLFNLPEKVLQFGTGILLRGLPDYFIDKANRKGVFNGRIIVVKSTTRGDTESFKKQNCLYTIVERGLSDNELIENKTICSSISRVLNSNTEWAEVLKCAQNPDLKIIISNTTEAGLKLDLYDQINRFPPISFPGKLLAFLYERFKFFNGKRESGFVIVPTELLPNNGGLLKSIIVQLAVAQNVGAQFLQWLDRENFFCSSLVDRIVIGMPDDYERDRIFKDIGYVDELLTVTEVYRLWAIQGNNPVIKKLLSFEKADPTVRIEPDIDIFRELKLRFLNCTHTVVSGIAFLSNIQTVREAMYDELTFSYINELMFQEINQAFLIDIDSELKGNFIREIHDRFRNPYLNHKWKSIAQNYSQKMKIRFLPLLIQYYKKIKGVPYLFAFGFASYIMYLRAVKNEGNRYYGQNEDSFYLIDDEKAGEHFQFWSCDLPEDVVKAVMQDNSFWDTDLLKFQGFYESVTHSLHLILKDGMKSALSQILTNKSNPSCIK